MVRFRRQRAGDADEIGFAEQRFERDEACAQRGEIGRIGVRVGGKEPHVEDPREAQRLAPDAAGADDAQRAPREPHAHVVGPLVPAAGAGEAILDQQLLRQREHVGERGGRHRSAHRVGRVRDQHAPRRHRGQVDRIEAHAVAGDQLDAQVAAADNGGGHPRRRDVEGVVLRGVGRRERVRDRRQVIPFDARGAVEHAQRRGAERRIAGGRDQIAGEADAEDGDSHAFTAGPSPRRAVMPSASAFWNSRWSMP